MKRSGFDHPKIGRLSKLLEVPRYVAVGIVESLWHLTAKHAPAGDVGKWSDDEIAESMGWSDEPLKLVEALVAARLLDRSEAHRLVVHDWDEHCEDAIHMFLARRVEFFVNGRAPKMARIPKDERAELQSRYEVIKTKRKRRKTHKSVLKTQENALPSQAMPSQAIEKKARFSPPAISEVRQYCQERRNQVDPQAFVDFYESKGWKVGDQAMRSWKACVRTWERRQQGEAEKKLGAGQKFNPKVKLEWKPPH